MKKKISKILIVITICLSLSGYSQTGVKMTVNQSPTLFSVTGGGSYCAGSAGVAIGLSGPQVGVNYQLVINGINFGMPIAGTGSPLNFGYQLIGGNCIVIATDILTGCSAQMSNSATITINPMPVVTISTNGTVNFCGSGTVTLTANAGSNHTYQWYKNGTIINGANLNQYVANATGMYKAIVTNAATGCSNNHDTMVQVYTLPQQFTVVSNNTTFCQGSGVTITLNSSQIGVNYQLMLNGIPQGVALAGTGLALEWTNISTAGNYTIVGTDNTSSCTNMMNGSITLTANPLPQAAGPITGPNSVCQNSTVVYTTQAIPNADTYIWSLPNWVTPISGQGTTQITVLVNQSGMSGSVSVRGHNNICNMDGASTSIELNVNAAPTLQITGNPSSFCAGTSATLTATGNANAFSWSTGATTQSINVAPTSNMTYSVTTTNSNGCSTIGTITLDVHPLPVVTLNLPETSFCADQGIMALSGGSPAGGVYSGNYIYNNSIVPSATPTGTYPITYTYTDTYGCMGIAVQDATFNSIPAIMFSNVPGPIYTNTPAFYLSGYVSPSGGTFSGPGVSGNIFNPAIAGPGTHMVTYTFVHPTTGCSNTQIQYITVAPSITSNIGEITISGITQEIVNVKIYNILGQMMYNGVPESETLRISTSSWRSGTHIIIYSCKNEQYPILTDKVVVIK